MHSSSVTLNIHWQKMSKMMIKRASESRREALSSGLIFDSDTVSQAQGSTPHALGSPLAFSLSSAGAPLLR